MCQTMVYAMHMSMLTIASISMLWNLDSQVHSQSQGWTCLLQFAEAFPAPLWPVGRKSLQGNFETTPQRRLCTRSCEGHLLCCLSQGLTAFCRSCFDLFGSDLKLDKLDERILNLRIPGFIWAACWSSNGRPKLALQTGSLDTLSNSNCCAGPAVKLKRPCRSWGNARVHQSFVPVPHKVAARLALYVQGGRISRGNIFLARS